jgi:hypothetical protein
VYAARRKVSCALVGAWSHELCSVHNIVQMLINLTHFLSHSADFDNAKE